MSERRIVLEKTKKGYPAIWEEGGGYTNTGSATVVASADGSPKKPVYIRKRGDLACREHALIIVEKGDYIVQANHHRRDFEIYIYKVINIIDEYHQEDRLDLIERINREEFRQRYGKDIKELPKLFRYSWDHYELPECPGIVFFHDIINDYVNIRKIENITMVTTYAEVELVNKFDCGEWEANDLDSSLAAVVDASKEKALCYHCRGPHYVQE